MIRAKAILFDLDGTIFDMSERDAFSRFEALGRLGYDISLHDVRRCYSWGIGRFGVIRALGIKLPDEEIEKYLRLRFTSFMDRKNALSLTRIHKGAHEVLSSLSVRYKLALVTSRDGLLSTEEELQWFNIRKFFDWVVTREVAAAYHGIREIPLFPFQEQRTKLYECVIGLTRIEPEDMLFIGDSLGELEPAKRLNIKAVGVLTGWGSKAEMDDADIPTIRNITEIFKILT